MFHQQYGSREYWESRYEKQKFHFDWLENYETLHSILQSIISSPSLKILDVGCGTSELSEKIYTEFNQKNITNIDFSRSVIHYMSEKSKEFPEMLWVEMDAAELKFDDETFDLIIDKGTTDSIYCTDTSSITIAKYYKEVLRVLKTGGIFLLVTHGNETRLNNLQTKFLKFDITVKKLISKLENDGFGNEIIKENTVYICKKTGNVDYNEYENYLKTANENKEEEKTL